MLTDLIFWLSSIPQRDLVLLLGSLLIFDAPRYLLGGLALWTVDVVDEGLSRLKRNKSGPQFDYCPTVCIIIAGLNESESLKRSLGKFWGTYPRMEIIVVDDGSSDSMSAVANVFARGHEGVRVITKQMRGGKSSAMNTALPLTKAEIIVVVDADSELSPTGVWEIVQPLQNQKVAAVSGNVLVRNHNKNLLTWIQAFEYQRSILLGRMMTSRIGTLGIVSGAFGAFRRSVLEQIGGWDVGPGEDEDVVLRIRKLGYAIKFAPYAECYTDVPTSLRVLTKQRRRWEWAVVTFESRKHIDMANPLSAHFRWDNFALFVERWLFNLFLPITFWIYLLWLLLMPSELPVFKLSVVLYAVFVAMEYTQWMLILFYSNQIRRDLQLVWLPPIIPLYQLFQRCVTSVAIVEEMLTRRSFRDTFVPAHVREATWQW